MQDLLYDVVLRAATFLLLLQLLVLVPGEQAASVGQEENLPEFQNSTNR
jgi:hypothetical protein